MAIWAFLGGARLISSELLVTEVPRALRGAPRGDPNFDLALSLAQAEILLEPGLRSLDAIHVVTALELRPIEAFVSYDKRQLEAAGDAGLPTVSPGMKK